MAGIRTLAIIKPCAVAAGHTDAIIGRIESAGFVIRARSMTMLRPEDVDALYGASKGKPWYPGHAAFMQSGPCVLLVLERADAVNEWRRIIGATDPRKAAPGTIRADFGDQNQEPGHCYRNAVHGSDTDEAAEREIGIFFGVSRCRACNSSEPGRRLLAQNGAGVGWCQDEWHLSKSRSDVDGICERAHLPKQATLSTLVAEIRRGRRKFPGGRFLLAALIEEVGELAQAVAEGRAEDVRAEAFQVAAVAVRIAEEGDQTRYALDRMISAVVGLGMGVRFLLQRNKTDALFSFGAAANAARRVAGSGDPTFDDLTDQEAQP